MPKIKDKVKIKDIKLGVKKMYPELESLEVTPTLNKNVYVPSKYGFNEVTVEAIETEDIRIAASKVPQKFTGVYREITVDPYKVNLQEKTVTPKEYEQVVFADSSFDGLSRVNVKKVPLPQTEELIITPTEEEQVFEGLFNKVTCEGAELSKPIELPIELTNIDGTIQIKVEGKNLFNANGDYDYTQDTSHANSTIINNNKIIINNLSAWCRVGCMINGLKPNTKYTVSSDITNPGGSNCGFWISESYYLDTKTNFKAICTYLSDENGNLYFQFYSNFSDSVSNSQVIYDNIQLEEGTESTEYEPYRKINLVDNQTATIKLSSLDKVVVDTVEEPEILYEELSYIQSTGTQYIDTEYPLFNHDIFEIVLDYEPTSLYNYAGIVGNSSNSTNCEWFASSSGYVTFRYNGTKVPDSGISGLVANNKCTLGMKYDGTKLYANVNTQIHSATVTKSSLNSNVYLLRSNNDYGKGKLYGAKLYANGTLVRDFIPVKDLNGVYCLYDLVESKFYYNAGSGSFTGA